MKYLTRYEVRVSIHAPNEGSDVQAVLVQLLQKFQSTLPMKGATLMSA